MSNSTATPWTIAHQAPLSMGFSRQEYWSGFAISSSRGSSWPRDQSYIFYIGRWVLYHWATRETQQHSGTTTLTYVSRWLLAPVTQSLYWDALSPRNSLTHILCLFNCSQPSNLSSNITFSKNLSSDLDNDRVLIIYSLGTKYLFWTIIRVFIMWFPRKETHAGRNLVKGMVPEMLGTGEVTMGSPWHPWGWRDEGGEAYQSWGAGEAWRAVGTLVRSHVGELGWQPQLAREDSEGEAAAPGFPSSHPSILPVRAFCHLNGPEARGRRKCSASGEEQKTALRANKLFVLWDQQVIDSFLQWCLHLLVPRRDRAPWAVMRLVSTDHWFPSGFHRD